MPAIQGSHREPGNQNPGASLNSPTMDWEQNANMRNMRSEFQCSHWRWDGNWLKNGASLDPQNLIKIVVLCIWPSIFGEWSFWAVPITANFDQQLLFISSIAISKGPNSKAHIPSWKRALEFDGCASTARWKCPRLGRNSAESNSEPPVRCLPRSCSANSGFTSNDQIAFEKVVIRKYCHLHQMVKQRFSPGRASFHLSEPLPRAIRTPCARWTKDSTQDLAGLTLANPWWLLEAPYFVQKKHRNPMESSPIHLSRKMKDLVVQSHQSSSPEIKKEVSVALRPSCCAQSMSLMGTQGNTRGSSSFFRWFRLASFAPLCPKLSFSAGVVSKNKEYIEAKGQVVPGASQAEVYEVSRMSGCPCLQQSSCESGNGSLHIASRGDLVESSRACWQFLTLTCND